MEERPARTYVDCFPPLNRLIRPCASPVCLSLQTWSTNASYTSDAVSHLQLRSSESISPGSRYALDFPSPRDYSPSRCRDTNMPQPCHGAVGHVCVQTWNDCRCAKLFAGDLRSTTSERTLSPGCASCSL